MGNDGFLTFTEKDWEKTPPERRDWIVYNTLRSMDERLKKLEQRRFLNFAWMFVGSAAGGALMILILITLKVKAF
ncbi:MAG: hypothetical protein GXX82_16505 [Syntrophorhabdus sp.]|jgi:hypothetical protein|nr:hypothetical protein [Syntrophorhabdus sp.]